MYKFSMIRNKFHKSSFFERCAFKELSKRFETLDKWEKRYTPYDSMKPYDVFLTKFNDGSIVGRIAVEIKIRSQVHNEYILEPKKIESIINYFRANSLFEDEYKRLFVNFTPTGTYLWDMNICKNKEHKPLFCNKTTANLSYKVNKDVYYLSISEVLNKVDYIWKEEDAIPYYEDYFGINKN